MRKYLGTLFPSLAVTLGMLVLPAVLTVYYVVTGYSNRFVSEENINYFDVQGNFLGKALIEQGWISWFNRFMDFAIWGLLAAIVLVGIWLVSSAKVATKNHYAEQSFQNFRETGGSWHGHFFTVAVLRIILVLVMIYSVLAIIGKSIPQLQTTITIALHDYSLTGVKEVALAALSIFAFEYLVVTSVKVFKHLSLD